MAAIPDEPLPPTGISTKALGDALSALGPIGDDLMRWMAVEHPTWARQLAARMVKVQGYCKKIEAGEPISPS